LGELRDVEPHTGGDPVLGGKLEGAVSGPVGQDAEDVPQVGLGIDAVKACRGDEGQQAGGAGRVIVTPNEGPVVRSSGFLYSGCRS
jgi:hypothetical protein